jgi:hypothetical protein
LKPNKSPGEDGIISEFYITHWEQIKDEFFLLVNDTFEKKELTPSHLLALFSSHPSVVNSLE